MNERYSRQAILPEIGPAGQERLGRGRVLCIGAGGLGCAVLPYLAGAGVGSITVIDADRVERGNLQRQVLFGESDLGEPKAEAAARRLADLNPEITITGRPERFDAANAEALFRSHDVVVDGSDNYPTKYLAADASVKFGVPLVYGSATGMEAMITVFEPGRGPCLRCLFPEAPAGWVPNCAEAGVLGPLVGAAGAVQAIEAIKLLAGGEGSALTGLAGRLWIMDARDLSVRNLAIGRRDDCATCGGEPGTIVLEQGPAPVREIGPEQLAGLEDAVVVDVRESDEFDAGHLVGAINIPLSALSAGQTSMPEAGLCVVYCSSGVRSRRAIELARTRSDADFMSLSGGIAAFTGETITETRNGR